VRNRIAFLLVAALLTTPVFAQSLADRVPGDAVIYAGWKGTDDPGAGYAQSHLKAMVDASNVDQLLHLTIPQIIAKYGGVDPQVGEVLRVLNTVGAAAWQHPSALYIGKLQAANGGSPPHALLLCRAGADAAALRAELEKLLQQNPAPMPTSVTSIGDLVVLAIDYQPNELKLPTGHDGQSLAENPAFKTTLAELGPDPVLVGYLDAAAVVSFVDQISKQPDSAQSMAKWPEMRDRLGLNELKQIAFSSGFDGKDWGTSVFVGCPEPRKGLLTAMDTQPLPDALLQTIPEGSVLAGAGRGDLAKTVEGLRSAVTAFDAQIGQQVDGVFSMASQTVGVDIQQELLPAFGQEWAYYVDPATGGKSMSSVAVINHLSDPAKTQATFAKFQAGLEKLAADQLPGKGITIAFHKVKIGDVEVNYLAVPLITPSWTIQGEYLCMGLYPQVVASAAAQIGHKSKSILTNKDFLALRTRLGGPAASSFQFMDERAMAPEGYAGWRAIASLDQIANIFGVDAPPAMMPPLDLLISHLSAGGQFAYADARGLHVRALTSFPGADLLASDPSSMSTGQSAMMMGVMLPALQKARDQARRVKSMSNLKQIGLAAMIYSNDQKDGTFPATLGDMLPQVENSANVFIDPRRESAPPPPGLSKEDLAKWVNEHSDYIWLGKGKKAATLGADHVLAYEKLEGATDGINILYGDGHVEFVQIDAARQQIDNARQANPNLPKNGGL
jgi:prepilin-type processing-associated H-X9-DG protein